MTTFSYNNSVPDANNYPGIDQPQMKLNTIGISGIIAVDHVGFNSDGSGPPNGSGGHHLQVTFDSKNVPIGAPTDPVSILYTNDGNSTTVSQLFFKNNNATFLVDAIKAFGSFVTRVDAGIIAPTSTSYNVINPVVQTIGALWTYTVTLAANVVNTTNFIVIATSSIGLGVSYTVSSPGVFVLQTINIGAGVKINFIVLEY
jgi:hypothetical protein